MVGSWKLEVVSWQQAVAVDDSVNSKQYAVMSIHFAASTKQ